MANAVNKAASFAALAEKTKSEAKLNAYRQALKHLKKDLVNYLLGVEGAVGHLNDLYAEAKQIVLKKQKSKKG